MITLERESVISTTWTHRFINEMVDTLSKKTSSSLYITKGDSRQIAMKSVIGLLSGNFKEGDEVKIIVIGDNDTAVSNDLQIAENLLKGEI